MVTDIRINVKSICFGSEDIELIFGDTVIPFYASYMGPEPVSTLLDSLIALERDAGQSYNVSWADEPGYLKIGMWKEDGSDILQLEVKYNNEGDGIYHKEEEWEFEISYQCYRKAVLNESIRLLKQYGLDGFNRNWYDGNDTFPLNSLLILLGNTSKYNQEKEYSYSDIFSELRLLEEALHYKTDLNVEQKKQGLVNFDEEPSEEQLEMKTSPNVRVEVIDQAELDRVKKEMEKRFSNPYKNLQWSEE